jgi:penicillin amidase
MKLFKFLLSFILTVGVFYILDTKIGSAPPIGKFLSPSQGVWQNESDESIDGKIQIEGLKDEVIVHYDEQLIPHVFAQNDADLYRAQGYITAKHRLWQMEFQTHASAGRLSEIIGEKALNYDRAQRRKGMGYGAEVLLKKWNQNTNVKNLLSAYTNGVNNYINSLNQSELPLEYKLLDYKPEPWTLKKSALLLMYMTDMLCGGETDFEYTNALREFGKDRFDMLYPDFYDFDEPVIPTDTDWSFIDVEMTKTPQSELPLDSITSVLEKPNPHNGSNNWAVGPSKS